MFGEDFGLGARDEDALVDLHFQTAEDGSAEDVLEWLAIAPALDQVSERGGLLI